MARFYFNYRQADCLVPDDEGRDLPDEEAAREEAIAAARDLVGNCIRHGSELLPGAFVVIDERGCPVATLPIEDVLSAYVGRERK